jgi:mannose-1-phosphate guanylyltransferase
MLHAVIMAGGSGTRFWPESRTHRPKQLLPVTGGRAMLAETALRLDPLVPIDRTWVVTNALQVQGVRRALPELPVANLLVEPCARNTAPCVALAAAVLFERDPDAVMAVLPADHAVEPDQDFRRALAAGASAAAERGVFVTFGIPPTFPATGYGYIRRGALIGSEDGMDRFAVRAFKEKPDAETAQAFLSDGDYLWNSGIFVWRADTLLDAVATHMPALHAGVMRIAEALGTDAFQETVDREYPRFDAVPVDIGIMEKVDGVQVLSTPFNWSDVGSWKALYELADKDDKGNAGVFPKGGLLLAEDAQGVRAYSSEAQTIAVLGLDDIVVVRTADAVLVAHRDRAEDVKRFVDELAARGRTDLL